MRSQLFGFRGKPNSDILDTSQVFVSASNEKLAPHILLKLNWRHEAAPTSFFRRQMRRQLFITHWNEKLRCVQNGKIDCSFEKRFGATVMPFHRADHEQTPSMNPIGICADDTTDVIFKQATQILAQAQGGQ